MRSLSFAIITAGPKPAKVPVSIPIDDIGRFTETFLMDSWLEVLHERERRTNADESMLKALRELLAEPPRVTFSIATDRPHRNAQRSRGEDQSRKTGEQL
jgi:Transmembrane secretion effector